MANKLTRTEKIQKLANAIRGYRGRYDLQTGKWLERPKPTEGRRVVDWLMRLKLDVKESIKLIQSFTQYEQLDAWLCSL